MLFENVKGKKIIINYKKVIIFAGNLHIFYVNIHTNMHIQILFKYVSIYYNNNYLLYVFINAIEKIYTYIFTSNKFIHEKH